jgi:zinc/manganese transport system substrate-binding protein
MRSVRVRVPFLLLVLVVVSSCGPQPARQPGPIRVLAAETFLADIAQNVAGDRLHVDSLLQPGLDPHEFQPAPQDAVRLAQSDVLIVNGAGYESWLAKSLQLGGKQPVTVVATLGLTPHPDPTGDHPDGDPHLWMDPLNVVRYVENIRDGLIKADPAGKDVYSANADAYIAKLKELDSSIKTQVAQIPPERRLLVTNHDALGYFADAYGFQVVGALIPGVTNEAAPSARQIAALIDSIRGIQAPAIFLDVGENQDLAQEVASATSARVVTDLYVETLSARDCPAPTYLDMLWHDTASIVEALK